RVQNELPAIIYDADSSQHSALLDALRGKNLVIEGPPGTGKSQTITNLIIAFLVRGKSVLFVSEKLTALEVVRRRLDQSGLGAFCLELHSHKTKKDRLSQDIRERIQKQNSFRDPANLEDKLTLLHKHKKELIEYVNLINQPFGQLRKTIFDILWARDNYSERNPLFEGLGDRLSIGHAGEITPARREHERLMVEIYQRQLNSLLEDHPTITAHPWFGVQNSELAYSQEREVVDLLTRLQSLMQQICEYGIDFNSTTGTQTDHSFKTFEALSRHLTSLPRLGTTSYLDILSDLKPKGSWKTIRQFLAWLGHYHSEAEQLRHYFVEIPPIAGNFTEARRLLAQLSSLSLGRCIKASLLALQAHVREAVNQLSERSDVVLGVANHMSIDIPLYWDSLRLVSDIAAELRRTNFEILYLRNTSQSNPALGSVRKEASRKAEELRRLESLLSREFVLGRLPSSEELWNHASSISSTSFAGKFFSAACKEAKQCHKTLSKNLEKADWDVMALNFKELAEFQDSLAGFSKNKQYAEAFGDCFNGLATPFNE